MDWFSSAVFNLVVGVQVEVGLGVFNAERCVDRLVVVLVVRVVEVPRS